LRGLRREPEAARGVLAVRDDGIDRMLRARRGEASLERVAARRTDDVADDEDGDRFDEGLRPSSGDAAPSEGRLCR
jgi:hypothetical protein